MPLSLCLSFDNQRTGGRLETRSLDKRPNERALQLACLLARCIYVIISIPIDIYFDRQVVTKALRLLITWSIVLEPFIFLIYILDLRRPLSFNIMCKYADDLSQLCPQRSSVTLKNEYAHIQEWDHMNNLSINISK